MTSVCELVERKGDCTKNRTYIFTSSTNLDYFSNFVEQNKNVLKERKSFRDKHINSARLDEMHIDLITITI